MSIELPFAPVDNIIRETDPDIRVSAGASERLAEEIQEKGSELAREASKKTSSDERKTIMPEDFDFGKEPGEINREELILPIAPVDRIARLKVNNFRVSKDARVVLTDHLEEWSRDVAEAASKLARHAGRRTVQSEDIDAYFEICCEDELEP